MVRWDLFPAEESGSPLTGLQAFAEMTDVHAQCCVLVVDDDATIRESVTALLEDEGYLVAQAANGLEALECLERQLPKVVLLDLRMPVMDGWEFVEELRTRQLEVRVVAMTATYDAQLWAQEIGATSYLGKPFAPEALLALVERLCQGSVGLGALLRSSPSQSTAQGT
jgi:CheY-like chemotaxis protein